MSSPEFPVVSSAEQVAAEVKLARTIMGDFYDSFRFSQGDNQFQRGIIFPLLGDYYREQLTPEQYRTIPSVMERYTQRVIGRRDPHNPSDPEGGPAEFGAEWDKFRDELQKSEGPKDKIKLLRSFAQNMVERDSKFVAEGRSPLSPPHESQYREYVLRAQAARSNAFNTMFAGMRDIAVNEGLPAHTLVLYSVWSRRHPQERFYPEAFMQEYRQAHQDQKLAVRVMAGGVALLDPAGLTGFES